MVDRREHDRKSAPLEHFHRLRLPARTRGVRHLREADRVFLRFLLRPGAGGRHPEHRGRRDCRRRHRHDPGLSGRHRPPVEQLARSQAGDGLCGAVPQHSAAAGDPVLVSGRPGAPAQRSRQRVVAAGLLSEQSRLLFSAPGVGARLVAGACRACRRRRVELVRGAPRPGSPDGDRPAVPRVPDQPGAHRRPAAARVPSRRPAGFGRLSAEGHLQPDGRHQHQARVPVALSGPVLLHRRLHRRDRARRYIGRAEGAGRRPIPRSGLDGGRACGWSSSRRPCASSSRPSPASIST